MTELPLARKLRGRAPEAVKRLLPGRRRAAAPQQPVDRPLLSVVVPIHDSAARLPRCLDSLAAQTLERLEIVLVDDGSRDGSAEIAQAFAEAHDNVRLVSQSHQGVGPARNAGVRAASGRFLAFCDSDDEVPPVAYERLVRTLQKSGSDLAVGSVSLQSKGLYQQPAWARRSNADRRLGVTLDEVPEVVANLLPGTRVFRRSFWDEHELSFGDDDHADLVTMVRAVLAADTLDVLAGVTYRWGWREDGRSLMQRDLREAERVACKVAQVVEAGDLVLAHASPQVQRRFFADILHTTVPDLVRAAVCRQDDYWSALQGQLRRLMERIPEEELADVPVEDRIVAWLCARAERGATEEFLEYAFDNQNGYPFRLVDGHPHIALPFIDALSSADLAMTRVAETDMHLSTRLTAMRWVEPGVLRVEGAAFVCYVEDTEDGEVSLVLRERGTGEETVLPVTRVDDPTVNRWSGRANEDHSRSAFTCDVDVTLLPRPDTGALVHDVLVRLEVAGNRHEGAFQSRRAVGSPGLLETSERDGVRAEPVWQAVRGLGLRTRRADAPAEDQTEVPAEVQTEVTGTVRPAPVTVTAFAGRPDTLELRGTADQDFEVALVGPRSRTGWFTPARSAETFSVEVSLLLDEWGLGPASLPTDEYAVTARLADGSEVEVGVAVELWRELPLFEDAGTHLLHPMVLDGGRLQVRVTPGEFRDSVGPYVRRRLRDEHYPAAREKPLLDVALFETFAGRAAGDNPGPLCEELARRDTGIDLVFAVVDRSVAVPDGARSVVRWSPEWYELLGRARYFVTNAPLPVFFRKRPGQAFVHTWHGSPLKRIAHDRVSQDFPNWHHRRQLLVARDGWDYLVSQSPFCTTALRSAFKYDGRVLELGYPRNDLLSSPDAEEVRRRTRAHFGIGEDTRVVLYAPTWRDNLREGRVFNKVLYLETAQVVEQVPDTVVLVRGHYNSMEAADSRGADQRVLDVTRYPDISHLYLAADALVTDYSSVFFDFVLTDKPMYFLAPDLQEYRDDNRGFYLDYHETVPGPVAVTTQEVVDALNGPDEHVEVRKRFRAEYAPWDDGRASERIIDVLLGEESPTE